MSGVGVRGHAAWRSALHAVIAVSLRYFGRRMLLFLSSHRDFDKMLEKFVPAKDLPTIRDAVFTLKTKVCSKPSQTHLAVFICMYTTG